MTTTTDTAPRLRMRGIAKSYGGVKAIRNADLEVRPGTVHALVGENGAGKSTLIKIVAGAERADRGDIAFDGEPTAIASTTDAIARGIQTVYQEPQLFPELSVAENVFVGRELHRGPRIDWRAQADEMHGLLSTVGLPDAVATVPVGQLTIAEQQQVSIAKALAAEASVLILDELFRIADEVTVMRDGETIATKPIDELSVREIAELMVGGVVTQSRERSGDETDAPVVLGLEGLGRGVRFEGVDLVVRAREVVGVYGLIGSGAGDLAETVYGIRPSTAGTISYRGRRVAIRRPRTARRLGISLLPANRSAQGSFPFQSIAFNITVGSLSLLSSVPGWVSRKVERRTAQEYIRKLAVKTPSEAQPLSAMSGGNAQKVVLARQLVRTPDLLLLAEPTQGVDVGAKEEIHRIIESLADGGAAVLVTTSDLGEALRISDRILVMRAGRIVAEFTPDATQVEILAAAAGDAGDDAAEQSGGAA